MLIKLELPSSHCPVFMGIKSIKPLCNRRNVARRSLLYRYFHCKYSDELHSLLPLVPAFTIRIYHAICIGSSHSHLYSIGKDEYSSLEVLLRESCSREDASTTIISSLTVILPQSSYALFTPFTPFHATIYFECFSERWFPLHSGAQVRILLESGHFSLIRLLEWFDRQTDIDKYTG